MLHHNLRSIAVYKVSILNMQVLGLVLNVLQWKRGQHGDEPFVLGRLSSFRGSCFYH